VDEYRDKTVKNAAFDLHFLQLLVIVPGKGKHRADIIVNNPHIYPAFAFSARISRSESHIFPSSMMKYSKKM
jgi:hypothetical protein